MVSRIIKGSVEAVWLFSPKSCFPLMCRLWIDLAIFSKDPACSLRTCKALLSSRLAANQQAVLPKTPRACSASVLCCSFNTFINASLAFELSNRLACISCKYVSILSSFGSQSKYLFLALAQMLCSLHNMPYSVQY